ncbi:MAG: hypothetical protein ACOY90_19860 [Candidatus Zhuqueibacterota bacterium]
MKKTLKYLHELASVKSFGATKDSKPNVRDSHPERCDDPGTYIPLRFRRWMKIQRDQEILFNPEPETFKPGT